MERERKLYRFAHIAKSALASLLAALVLVSALFAANPSLHRYLHRDGSNSAHPCLVCAFVKGQVNTPDIGSAIALVPAPAAFIVNLVQTEPIVSPDRRLSPSRAPPLS